MKLTLKAEMPNKHSVCAVLTFIHVRDRNLQGLGYLADQSKETESEWPTHSESVAFLQLMTVNCC